MSAYSDAVVADSPVAYWRFGESSGTIAEPAVGANHGTYNNCALGEPGLLPIDAATSVYFNGTSAYITTPGNAGVSQPPLTVEFWVKPDQDAMIGTFDSAPNATNVIRNYDGDRFEWWNASPYISYNFIRGTKYHVVLVCVMDAGWRRIKLYVNGSLIDNKTGSDTGTSITSWRFGDINNGVNGRYKGWMQDVALYNKELSNTRVSAHYLTGIMNILLGKTVMLESGKGLWSRQLIPLWADGEKSFYSSPFAPNLEFRGFVYPVDHVPFESEDQFWVSVVDQLPASVDLGWLYPIRKLAFGSAGWLDRNRKSPFEASGLTALLHLWGVLQPSQSVLSHAWNVAQTVQTGEIVHHWTVKTEDGGALPHLWRTVKPQLVTLHGQDIQLPYGHLEKT